MRYLLLLLVSAVVALTSIARAGSDWVIVCTEDATGKPRSNGPLSVYDTGPAVGWWGDVATISAQSYYMGITCGFLSQNVSVGPIDPCTGRHTVAFSPSPINQVNGDYMGNKNHLTISKGWIRAIGITQTWYYLPITHKVLIQRKFDVMTKEQAQAFASNLGI